MFLWQREMDSLTIPARRVLRLQRSLNRIQVGMPGFPSQEATAYLCAFVAGQGIRVAVVLDLHASRKIAVYLNDQGEVPDRRAGSIFSEGVGFAESMGFMLNDMEFQKLSREERENLWSSLPLSAHREESPQPPAALTHPPERNEGEIFPDLDLVLEEGWTSPLLRRRRRPTPAEMEERRLKLRENLGRFLASL